MMGFFLWFGPMAHGEEVQPFRLEFDAAEFDIPAS